jgi:hypothetical protein
MALVNVRKAPLRWKAADLRSQLGCKPPWSKLNAHSSLRFEREQLCSMRARLECIRDYFRRRISTRSVLICYGGLRGYESR